MLKRGNQYNDLGPDHFDAWAWRIPFLFSFLLVFVTLYMRISFEESPVYAEIKAKGQTSKNPWREAFLEEISLNEAARLPMIAQRGSHRMFGLGRQFAT